MTPQKTLHFQGGFLRPLEPKDVHEGYVAGLNDPEINRFLDGVKSVRQSMETVEQFVRDNASSSDSVLWGVWLEGSDRHCGTVRVHGIEHRHGTAHIGVCIFDKSLWGQSVGKRTVKAVTDWAMSSNGLRWVEAGAYAGNVASQKVFLAAGYTWAFDIPGKFLFEGKPTQVKVYAAQREPSLQKGEAGLE